MDEAAAANRKAWIVTWILAILPLLGWWSYGLFDMDEGFYGAVVAEMNRRGEWITPFYNGHPWFEKPILLYWLAKPAMLAFGQWFGPRLPSVIANIGAYALVGWFARRRWGDQVARWCVLVAASSIFLVGLGRMMMTDAILDTCLAGAFLTFWESIEGNPRWRLLTAFFLGLSVLAKGPVGLALFVPVAAWTFWREKQLRTRFRGWWALGTLILAATIASWYLPAYLVDGHLFVQKFLIEQNIGRFTGGDAAHTLPFLQGLPMYFIVILIGMAPWSFYIVKAWPRNSEPALRYLVVWAAVPFIFFTISRAKLPTYVLPCFPPLAILVGHYLASRQDRDKPFLEGLRYPLIACGVAAIVANAAFLAYYRLAGFAEVDRLAIYVRANRQPGEEVSAYQMPRRQRSLGTGKAKIQETSLPSLAMYLSGPVNSQGVVVNEPDEMGQLLSDSAAQWVLTREGRIQPSDVDLAAREGRELSPVQTPTMQVHYRLYYLSAQPSSRSRR